MKSFCKKISLPLSRLAIFIVYFYFGALKVFSEHGAANPMVRELLHRTMPFVSSSDFLIFFGIFEMVIGLLFLMPKFTKLAVFLLAIHMGTTIMPLFIMTEYTWRSTFVPTIEGQYIIKNILIIALAVSIFANSYSRKENV